jgi:hypothetical protein
LTRRPSPTFVRSFSVRPRNDGLRHAVARQALRRTSKEPQHWCLASGRRDEAPLTCTGAVAQLCCDQLLPPSQFPRDTP